MKKNPAKSQEILDLIDNHHMPIVKMKKDGAAPHKGHAKLVSSNGKTAVVLPLGGHKRLEVVPVDDLSAAKSKSKQNDIMIEGPALDDLHIRPEQLLGEEPALKAKKNADPGLTADLIAVMELVTEEILGKLPAAEAATIACGTLDKLVRELFLGSEPRNFRRLYNQIRKETTPPWSKEKVRLKVVEFIGIKGGLPATSLLPAISKYHIQPDPPPVEPVPATRTEKVADSPGCPESIQIEAAASLQESTHPASAELLRTVLRRVVRDHDGIANDEKYELEAALVGAPHLNERLESLGIDTAASGLLKDIYDITLTPSEVRDTRHSIWPAPAVTRDLAKDIASALRDGSLQLESLIGLIVSNTEQNTPTKLARRIVEFDLAERPPLPPV